MKRLLSLVAVATLIQACASTEETVKTSVNASLNQKAADFRNLATYPGNVTCGEYLEMGFYKATYNQFIAIDGETLTRPKSVDLAVFCSTTPLQALNESLSIDYKAQQDSLERIRRDFEELDKALQAFKEDQARYPSTEEGLKALEDPANFAAPFTTFPEEGYLSALPQDPWGNPYDYYMSPMAGLDLEYDLQSFGADGVPGGEGENADIKSNYERYFEHIDNL